MRVSMSEVEDDKTDTAKEERRNEEMLQTKEECLSLSLCLQARKGVERTLLAGIIKIYAHIKR